MSSNPRTPAGRAEQLSQPFRQLDDALKGLACALKALAKEQSRHEQQEQTIMVGAASYLQTLKRLRLKDAAIAELLGCDVRLLSRIRAAAKLAPPETQQTS